MYFPYLRGKQFELKALREFAIEHPNEKKIIPIIEPINSNYAPISTAIQEMNQNGVCFALILNPKDGDFSHPNINFDSEEITYLKDNEQCEWIPAYLYHNNPQELRDLVDASAFKKIMIVFREPAEIGENDILSTIISDDKVSYIIFNDNSSRRTKSFLRSLRKNLIGLNDCFNEKPKNSDYLNREDELFSEMPFFYREDRLYGFADYTALSSKYIEGGMTPYAVAIHLTYQKAEDLLYIHHFVSDSNRTRADIRGKFNEAAIKIKPFYENNNITITSAVQDLINRANSGEDYPGLGYLKKLSILNHLELIHRILS